jgi:hypothetical protein
LASFLIVASTHTHAGSDTLGLYGPKPLQTRIDGKYLEWVDQGIASTAADAVRAMQPASLELGREEHPRRDIGADQLRRLCDVLRDHCLHGRNSKISRDLA